MHQYVFVMQGETESLYANIDKAYKEGESGLSRLKKPFRIEVEKNDVIASYRVNYIGVSNLLLPCACGN